MDWSSSPTAQTLWRVAGQQAHQLVLRAVGVLILVDQEVLEAAVVVLAHRGDDFQQAHGLEQQVVEIERVGLAQLFAILLVDVRHLLGLGIGRLQVHLLRIEHVVLGPGNMRPARSAA